MPPAVPSPVAARAFGRGAEAWEEKGPPGRRGFAWNGLATDDKSFQQSSYYCPRPGPRLKLKCPGGLFLAEYPGGVAVPMAAFRKTIACERDLPGVEELLLPILAMPQGSFGLLSTVEGGKVRSRGKSAPICS